MARPLNHALPGPRASGPPHDRERAGGPRSGKTKRRPPLSAAEIQARVLYRDGLILVIDKPAGLAVHAGPSKAPNLEECFDALRLACRARRRWPIASTPTPRACWCWAVIPRR